MKTNRSAVLNMFVHIPKTAGTSFRASLENSQNVVNDYGKGKEHTSEVVSRCIYHQNDTYALKEAISHQDTWLCGHMHLNKYLGIVSPQNIVTFVREPVARVVSHFNHELRWGNKAITIEEFLRSNRAQNFQHRFLQGLPLSLIGFVGITEQYGESLTLIENEMSLRVEEAKFNANDQKVSDIEDIDKELLTLIEEQNALDRKLYEDAKEVMAQRKVLAQAQLPWTYIHAELTAENTLVGVAFRRNECHPIELEINVNGESREVVVANEDTILFPQARFPRERFVGFSTSIPIKTVEDIMLEVKDTKQQYRV